MTTAETLAVITGVLWSLNPPVIKRFARDIDPITLNGVRGFYAVLTLLPYIIIQGNALVIDTGGLLLICLSAILGPFLGDTFYVKAIMSIGGGNAITIGYLYIFVAQLISVYALGEPARLSIFMGSIVAFLGVYIIYRGNGFNGVERKGFIYALNVAVLWGLSSICSKLATQYGDPLTLVFYRNVFLAAIVILIRDGSVIRHVFSRNGFIAGLITGGLSFGVGMLLFIQALAVGGVSVSVLPTIIAPALARFTSRFIVGEGVDARTIIGTVITVTGILIGSL